MTTFTLFIALCALGVGLCLGYMLGSLAGSRAVREATQSLRASRERLRSQMLDGGGLEMDYDPRQGREAGDFYEDLDRAYGFKAY